MPHSRRHLLTRLPDAVVPGPEVLVRQVFWRLGDGWVLRLRREGPPGVPPRDTLAVRGPGDVEWTLPLDAAPAGARGSDGEAVAGLFRAGAGHRVVATRRRYRLDGRDWDVDEYHWENEGLILARGDAPRPGWAVRDVTGEPAYDEENLARAPFTTWAAPSR